MRPVKLPPLAGSTEEYAETALAVGWLGAFVVSSMAIEQGVQTYLLRES